MTTRDFPPLIEAYLLVEQPRQRLSHWTQALAALDSRMAPPLAAIVAFYDPTCDQALLNLRYDELALGPSKLEFVVEVALLAEVGMIQPGELSESERRRFLTDRLTRCTVQVPYERSAVGALTELVRKLREQKTSSSPRGALSSAPPAEPAGSPPPIASLRSSKPPPFRPRPNVAPRGDTADPIPLVSARGTRDDLSKVSRMVKSTRDLARADRPERHDEFGATPTHRHVIPRSSRAPTVERTVDLLRPSTETEIEDVPPSEPGRARSPAAMQYLPTDGGLELPSTIYARYLRSGKWVPIRIGALSLKGAALMAGALPRLHDHVDVALTFGGHRALVRGAVGKVSSVREAASTGASTFSVNFELDNASRRQLTQLLTAARAANITIKPPPPRVTRRFPVEWPVALGTTRGALKADALDVSTYGMFVRPVLLLTLDSVVNFSVVLDDGNGPIAGRAKVVRHVTGAEAQACGLAPGFGLSIVDMTETDRSRWDSFITRIERRAEKRVLIGASPARLGELQAALAGAGYAVMGGTDPGALVQLANADTRPVDAALIDAGWLQNGASASWVESLFMARDVPCVTVHGDGRRARTTIDRLLEVVS